MKLDMRKKQEKKETTKSTKRLLKRAMAMTLLIQAMAVLSNLQFIFWTDATE